MNSRTFDRETVKEAIAKKLVADPELFREFIYPTKQYKRVIMGELMYYDNNELIALFNMYYELDS